ncbi:PREDICTED: uncharacterized protein LOC106320047 [Brassica oleracea var. oleracea]|uniref:uncharacterized protein LOC106320047 n=1 Tax=Brassica oleracea var. oleracea TaxID=109376 RepID=UPI0006A7526E|nr:PREDICTED: uncharacterized protein LOC106320047 [Brassica oleracea var. oleracea]
MAAEKFGPHLKTILKGKHIDAIYELWGVSYAVEIESPRTAGGLSFPLPRFLLEVLAEIKMAFTQIARNFFRYFLGCWVRAQEEGLEFGLRELKQLFSIKRNNGFHGTMIISPRGGRVIIEGIPNKDDRWRENFFVLKINLASVGDFDFERIPREWSDDIEPFGSAPMSLELRGLMETLRRGSTCWLSFTPDRIQAAYALPPGANRATPVTLVAPVRPKRGQGTKRKKDEEVLLDRPDESSEAGSSERDRKVHRGRVLRPRSQAQSPGLLARPVSVAFPSGGARKAPDTSASSAGDRALNDEIDSLSRQSRRRVLEELTLWLRDRRARNFLRRCVLLVKVLRSEIPILENPESLAEIWCKIRAEGCELPSLEHMRERDAYVRMAVANAKLRGELDTARETERQRELDFEKLKKKLAASEAEKGVVQRDLNSMEEKYRREIEGRDRKARKDLHLARVSLVKEYEGVLAVVRGKLEQKKKETAAEILLQETRAHIEALPSIVRVASSSRRSWSAIKTWRFRSTSITVLLRCRTLLLVVSISPRSPETRSTRIDARITSI